ncbi:MAG: serine/threonine-protein kinase [Gemmatimonadetes bacterium]|nr:serine/threonine-protein kinase [Gemmatimonadota bacterium]
MPPTRDLLSTALADRYRIERELGAGGMATVYLAHDLRHDRRVALKVLRPELAAMIGAERFLAEIKVTANLQHPHILALFESGRTGGAAGADLVYYVMPYVEGETLRGRLTRERQLPVDEAIRLAREVADALEYAHARGVVHRDIKPENILLHGGHALVADFGIALAASRSEGATRMTETGMSLGTPHYMSPEQAMGERDITARSDIYALGCVLYEMLTGEPPFTGPSAQAIVARVMTEEPRSLTLQRRSVPPAVEDAVLTALEKLPADRFPSAAAFAAALVGGATSRTPTRRGPAARRATGAPPVWALALGALAIAAVTFGLTRWFSPGGTATGTRPLHVSVAMPDGHEMGSAYLRPLAISPDGTRLAYVIQQYGKTRLYLRALDQPEGRVLEGTEGGAGPFFSPDGEWVGFFSAGKLRKVSVTGTGLQELAAAPFHRGGDWGHDGFIYFAPNNSSGIWRVPEAGGTATQVTQLDTVAGEVSHRWPRLAAGSSSLLFSIWTGPGDEEHQIAVQEVGAAAHHILARGGDAPSYAATPGRLLYVNRGRLLTVPWRPGKEDLGTAVPVATAERPFNDIGNEGSGNYVLSRDGTLAYVGGGDSLTVHRVVWIDRAGTVTPLPLPSRIFENVVISPDGSRAALQIREGVIRIWIYDFARGTLTPLNTGTGSSQAPLWTPDGKRVIYRGTRGGTRNLYWIPVDGSGAEERLTTAPGRVQTPTSISADGRTLLFNQTGDDEEGGAGIWRMQLDGDRTATRLFPRGINGLDGQLSPDGRWVAYHALVASRPEIFVAPLSGEGERRLVSTEGGTEPLWSRNGRELFFQAGDRLMGVTVAPGASFSAGPPRTLHTGRYLISVTSNTSYGVTPDASRFLRIQPLAQQPAITRLELVLNWYAELTKRP